MNLFSQTIDGTTATVSCLLSGLEWTYQTGDIGGKQRVRQAALDHQKMILGKSKSKVAKVLAQSWYTLEDLQAAVA